MPTYDYKCTTCGGTTGVFQSIRGYSEAPRRPICCEKTMERMLSVVPAMSALANALAGDRHYDGLRAQDGTDISSRSKHREYMKRHGYTTTDDFKDTWAKAQREREEYRKGTLVDSELRKEITEQVTKAVAQPD